MEASLHPCRRTVSITHHGLGRMVTVGQHPGGIGDQPISKVASAAIVECSARVSLFARFDGSAPAGVADRSRSSSKSWRGSARPASVAGIWRRARYASPATDTRAPVRSAPLRPLSTGIRHRFLSAVRGAQSRGFARLATRLNPSSPLFVTGKNFLRMRLARCAPPVGARDLTPSLRA